MADLRSHCTYCLGRGKVGPGFFTYWWWRLGGRLYPTHCPECKGSGKSPFCTYCEATGAQCDERCKHPALRGLHEVNQASNENEERPT